VRSDEGEVPILRYLVHHNPSLPTAQWTLFSSRGTEAHSWNLQHGIDPDDRPQVTPFIRLIQQTISLGCILAKYGGQCCDRKYTDLPLLVPLLNNDAIPELTFGDPDH